MTEGKEEIIIGQRNALFALAAGQSANYVMPLKKYIYKHIDVLFRKAAATTGRHFYFLLMANTKNSSVGRGCKGLAY